jgi:hypothetical protein
MYSEDSTPISLIKYASRRSEQGDDRPPHDATTLAEKHTDVK